VAKGQSEALPFKGLSNNYPKVAIAMTRDVLIGNAIVILLVVAFVIFAIFALIGLIVRLAAGPLELRHAQPTRSHPRVDRDASRDIYVHRRDGRERQDVDGATVGRGQYARHTQVE
jgi:hypothetical protein